MEVEQRKKTVARLHKNITGMGTMWYYGADKLQSLSAVRKQHFSVLGQKHVPE